MKNFRHAAPSTAQQATDLLNRYQHELSLATPRPTVRESIRTSLLKLGRTAAERLVHLTRQSPREAWPLLADMVQSLSMPAVVEALREAAQDLSRNGENARQVLVQAGLAVSGPQQVARELIKGEVTTACPSEVAHALLRLLRSSQKDVATPWLSALQGHPDGEVRLIATELLDRWRPPAPPAPR